jgi:hypothetical protein
MAQELTRCENCDNVLRRHAGTCPACGSSRLVKEALFDFTVEVAHDLPMNVEVVNADAPTKKVPKRIEIKREVHHDSGRIQQTHRTFDRSGDSYRERIVDARTGEVFVENEEPLSEHRGHGSAKDRAPSGETRPEEDDEEA